MTDRLQQVQQTGVFAVLRAPDAEHAIEAARALIRGGITGIEVTYSTPGAPDAIRELVAEFGDSANIGAGTVTSAERAEAAADAGAQFLVSPGSVPAVTEAMLETGLTVMTGALTPTEVMTALDLGSHVVKLFPAALAGPPLLKALRGPFGDAHFMPTGGVSAENLGEWFAAGALAVGAGSDLVSSARLAERDWDGIEAVAGEFTAALQKARA